MVRNNITRITNSVNNIKVLFNEINDILKLRDLLAINAEDGEFIIVCKCFRKL